jgi:hypothetical protein
MKFLNILFVFLFSMSLIAQQPQTSTAPIIPENAKYVQGVGPGFWPKAGAGLTLNLTAGTVNCNGTIVTYSGGTLSMTASTTNYVYLNTSSSCVPAVKTGAFTSSDIPLAIVATSSVITSITDDRTIFQAPNVSSGGTTVNVNGSSIGSTVNFNSTTPSADIGESAATIKKDGSGNVIVEFPTAPTFQTNSTNNSNQTTVNFETSTTNSVGLTATPVSSSGGVEKIEITGNNYTGKATDLSGTPAHTMATWLTCVDTSGSGTAQSCTTTPTFTPVANDCIIYSTTTANTGSSLTLNVNSLGAVSVAKWQGETTLVAGDVAVANSVYACYTGTVWNLSSIGNDPAKLGNHGVVAVWNGPSGTLVDSDNGGTGYQSGATYWGKTIVGTYYILCTTTGWPSGGYIGDIVGWSVIGTPIDGSNFSFGVNGAEISHARGSYLPSVTCIALEP